MGLPHLFKLPKYNVFNYTPRYYNAKREEREQRNRDILLEEGIKPEGEYVPNIKGRFKHYYGDRKKAGGTTNLRLIIIIAFLTLLSYFIFYY